MQPNSKQQTIDHPMAVMQPGERVICQVTRHPIGMIGVYFSSTFTIILMLALGLFFLPDLLTSSGNITRPQAVTDVLVIVFGIAILIYASVALIHFVYWQNRWIVTTDSITQVTQLGVFRKHTSQLSLANLEDVTVNQDGLLPSIFHYGTLKAETAGERSKFTITYCRKPNECAREILNARELFMDGRSMEGGMKESQERSQPQYQSPQQPQPQQYEQSQQQYQQVPRGEQSQQVPGPSHEYPSSEEPEQTQDYRQQGGPTQQY